MNEYRVLRAVSPFRELLTLSPRYVSTGGCLIPDGLGGEYEDAQAQSKKYPEVGKGGSPNVSSSSADVKY